MAETKMLSAGIDTMPRMQAFADALITGGSVPLEGMSGGKRYRGRFLVKSIGWEGPIGTSHLKIELLSEGEGFDNDIRGKAALLTRVDQKGHTGHFTWKI